MKNLFFYIRKDAKPVEVSVSSAIKQEFTEYIDCFNTDKVIRAISLEGGKMLVLLDDIHERIEKIPVKSNKGNLMNYRAERGTYQSEIYLEPEDAKRFILMYDDSSISDKINES